MTKAVEKQGFKSRHAKTAKVLSVRPTAAKAASKKRGALPDATSDKWPKPGVLQVESVSHEEPMGSVMSRLSLRATINAGAIIEPYNKKNILGQDVDINCVAKHLSDLCKEVNGGDLSRMEAMLVSQAVALQTMFTHFARRAVEQEELGRYETITNLALKAQAQSRATISALVDLKYPRQATFVKQANIANGPQQVNNGTPAPAQLAPAEEVQPTQNKLLEHQHANILDTGAPAAAGRSHSAVAAVGAVNRAAQRQGKRAGGAQRVQGR